MSFAIADGIQPGNTDRNYVLRRILRRAVRYGRTLGFHEPFFYKLVDVLADTMGDVFPEIRARKKQVQETIRTEEEAFNKTLDRGIKLFDNEVLGDALSAAAHREGFLMGQTTHAFGEIEPEEHEMYNMRFFRNVGDKVEHLAEFSFEELRGGAWKQILKTIPIVSGKDAFKLYDTYGFPLDLTELMARERGLTVDKDGFEKLMEEQRARARAAQKKEIISLSQIETTAPTKFVGFEQLERPRACSKSSVSKTKPPSCWTRRRFTPRWAARSATPAKFPAAEIFGEFQTRKNLEIPGCTLSSTHGSQAKTPFERIARAW